MSFKYTYHYLAFSTNHISTFCYGSETATGTIQQALDAFFGEGVATGKHELIQPLQAYRIDIASNKDLHGICIDMMGQKAYFQRV